MNRVKRLPVPVLGLAGPSASGKSTLARHSQLEIPDLTVIKLDNFYKERTEFPVLNGRPNWELPINFRWDEIVKCLQELREGRSVFVPVYSKREGRRLGLDLICPGSIILVEGFLVLNYAPLRDLMDRKIFLRVARETQWIRRNGRDNSVERHYFDSVIWRTYRKFGRLAIEVADCVIEAEGNEEEVWRQFKPILESI